MACGCELILFLLSENFKLSLQPRFKDARLARRPLQSGVKRRETKKPGDL
jgi:hypothetical protein